MGFFGKAKEKKPFYECDGHEHKKSWGSDDPCKYECKHCNDIEYKHDWDHPTFPVKTCKRCGEKLWEG